MSNFYKRFCKAVDYLYDKDYFLATELSKLGLPKIESKIPTAGVAWDEEHKKILFMFNEDFFNSLNDEQLAFVLAHEISHVMFFHIFTMKEEANKIKAKTNDDKKEIDKFLRKFNIAMDCVVNDSLLHYYKMERCFAEGKAVYGKETVGIDCHDLTAREVYQILPEDIDQQIDIENHFWETFFDENGNLRKEFSKSLKDLIENNLNNSCLSDKERFFVEDMKESMKNAARHDSNIAGNVPMNKFRSIMRANNTIKWDFVLSEFVDTKKIIDTWNRPNKNLMQFYPDVLLPHWKDQEKQKIFCAIDASGSIDYKAFSLFVNILKNSPKHIEVEAISFDTNCYPYDIENGENPRGGGGTCFNIIENYIQQNLKKYPRAVFVLTDGHGSIVNPQYPARWCWLLYGQGHSDHYCTGMKKYDIYKLLK